jgi:Phosphotransferase system, HPr-related proteins
MTKTINNIWKIDKKVWLCDNKGYLFKSEVISVERSNNMTERYIKLSAKEDVKEFVSRASKCNFDIDISYNRMIVDAKSILGVLSLDLSRKLTVQYREADSEFEAFLNNYAII